MHSHISYLLLLLLLTACIKNDQTTVQDTSERFNLPAFFDKEIKRLSDNGSLKIEKRIRQNAQEELKVQKIENWEKELQLFSTYNIHEAIHQDDYDSSKIVLDNGNYHLTYQSINPKLALKHLTLHYNKQKELQKLEMQIEKQNQVYSSYYQLNYQPQSGYRIKKKQKVLLFPIDSLEVQANFVNE